MFGKYSIRYIAIVALAVMVCTFLVMRLAFSNTKTAVVEPVAPQPAVAVPSQTSGTHTDATTTGLVAEKNDGVADAAVRTSRSAAQGTSSSARTPATPASGGAAVLKTATAFKNGGGFNWDSGTGCPDEVQFKGTRILSKARSGSYCCGYTFAVVMRTAAETGLLQDKSVKQIRKFQQHWYAATPEAKEKMQIYALQYLGIGHEVPLMKAEPGDFIRLWHGHSGHSVILVRWIVESGKRVGIEYRGTQSTTDGIGNRVEYIEGTSGHDEATKFIPERTYAGRLNAKTR